MLSLSFPGSVAGAAAVASWICRRCCRCRLLDLSPVLPLSPPGSVAGAVAVALRLQRLIYYLYICVDLIPIGWRCCRCRFLDLSPVLSLSSPGSVAGAAAVVSWICRWCRRCRFLDLSPVLSLSFIFPPEKQFV